MLERPRISERLLPEVRRSGTVVGEVSADAAAACGLRAGTPIVVGGADHVSSAYGAGLLEAGDWLVKLGGAGDILVVSEVATGGRAPVPGRPPRGAWLPNGCMATSGSLVRWLARVSGGVSLDAARRRGRR